MLRNGLIPPSSGQPVGVEDFTLYPTPKPTEGAPWQVVMRQMESLRRSRDRRAEKERERKARRSK